MLVRPFAPTGPTAMSRMNGTLSAFRTRVKARVREKARKKVRVKVRVKERVERKAERSNRTMSQSTQAGQ